MKKLIFFLLFTGVAVGEQYLCVTEKAVGFSYDEARKEWKNTNFNPSSKYLISKADGTKYAWKVTKIGEQSALIFCEADFSKFGYLSCSGIGELKFNKRNGRFLHTYPVGYFNVLPEVNEITDEGSDTPLLQIGKCSPF